MSSDPFGLDLLNRRPFATRFERFLLTEHHFVEGALVATLNAPFGAGKTTFIRMWTDDLRARRQGDASIARPVILNAWETDHCGDPLVAIVSALKDALTEAPDPQPLLANRLTEAVKDIGWFALGLASGVVSDTTGVDALQAGELATEKKAERARAARSHPADLLEAYEQRQSALARIKTALRDTFQGDEARAFVIIDELDRCRPDYAVNYLETIKHIFDVHGIVFVLCVDEQQLASAASVLFGPRLTFDDYYRKFSHRTIRLPEPTQEEQERLSAAYVARYLAVEGKRWTAVSLGDGPVSSIPEIFRGLEMRPRQAQEAFRVIGHAFAKQTKDQRDANWMWCTLVILMAALRVARTDLYVRLARADATPRDAAEITQEILGKARNPSFWFELLVSSLRRDAAWEAATLEQLKASKRLGPQDDTTAIKRVLGDFLRWNNAEVSLALSVAERIENITSFSER